MKTVFQMVIVLVAAFFMRPILAENTQAPAPAPSAAEAAPPATPEDQTKKEGEVKPKANATEAEKKLAKERRAQEVNRRLQEIFERKPGKGAF